MLVNVLNYNLFFRSVIICLVEIIVLTRDSRPGNFR